MNILSEETKEELNNIAENIWSAAILLESRGSITDKPLWEALFKHYQYLHQLAKNPNFKQI